MTFKLFCWLFYVGRQLAEWLVDVAYIGADSGHQFDVYGGLQ